MRYLNLKHIVNINPIMYRRQNKSLQIIRSLGQRKKRFAREGAKRIWHPNNYNQVQQEKTKVENVVQGKSVSMTREPRKYYNFDK